MGLRGYCKWICRRLPIGLMECDELRVTSAVLLAMALRLIDSCRLPSEFRNTKFCSDDQQPSLSALARCLNKT